MGTRIKQITYSLFFILYGVSVLAKKNYFTSPQFVTSYLADILAVPIVLFTSLTFLRKLRKDPRLQLSLTQIIVAFLYISLLFELALPYWKEKYTADYLDIICYLVGTILYLILEKTPLQIRKSAK